MQIHLDVLGGLAGDMFLAALLDAYPEHMQALEVEIARIAPAFGVAHPQMSVSRFQDGVFVGSRFAVVDPFATPSPAPARPHAHAHAGHFHTHDAHDDAADGDLAGGSPVPNGHGHVNWGVIRARLADALVGGVKTHALGIFTLLAEAEAAVHGVPLDAVEFHEVGAWDSVVDIVAAASFIAHLDTSHWSASAIPLGSGRVRTAHGPMPVPTPATVELLRGFKLLDDGIAGERVTPTGAAILRYLMPDGQPASAAGQRVLRRAGVGFGTRRLDGISNCVRVLVFDDPASVDTSSAHRELSVIEFEVDDQSAEELALGLDRLRQHDAVFDVVQMPVYGKKGRTMTSVRLLARPVDLAAVIEACFRETTTIGLRHATVLGAALPRRSEEVLVGAHRIRVKIVERPGGATAKAESDDALAHETHRARRQLRHDAEKLALARYTGPAHE